ncbi:MAG: WYL domain-containing protein [Bacteroidales bacterium]|nr:WYL domain-containing protein [Bacteroidales bacterium]
MRIRPINGYIYAPHFQGLLTKNGFKNSEISLALLESDYASAHSDETRDRVVEPFSFTANMIEVWAYDVENADCRVFKVMRIGAVEVLSDDWAFENLHEVRQPDVFRMTGSLKETVVLELNTRAKGLLVEEYPLAERDLKREDGKWILRTTVQALEGVGRFVIGLAADVKVVEGKKLVEYVRRYDKKWVQKI